MDSSKAHVADVRHRALLHSSFGIYLLEQVFGKTFTNSQGRVIDVRDIGEQHVMDALGEIPSDEHYFMSFDCLWWFGGTKRKSSTNSIKGTNGPVFHGVSNEQEDDGKDDLGTQGGEAELRGDL